MEITFQVRGDALWVQLEGELDHHSAARVRLTLDDALAAYPAVRQLRMNLSMLTFMDSAGVGVLIGRYKTLRARRGIMTLYGMQPPVGKLVELAGLSKIMKVE